jgi:prolycopene isomerase
MSAPAESDRSEPRSDAYDAVVIGSGFGGVSTAALLARAGLSVLLCERGEGLGGYGHAIKRGPYTFDPAVRVTYAVPLYRAVLAHIGTADRCELVQVARTYDVALPDGRRLKAPAGVEQLTEAHVAMFPHAAEGLTSYFRMAYQMHVQGHALPMTLGLHNLDEAAARFPEYFSHQKRTMGDVAQEHISDEEARFVVCAPWPYQGTPPSRVGFVPMSQTIANAAEGTFYSIGSFQTLIDAVVAGFELHGGDVVTSNGARRITVRDGKVTGVVLDSGHEVRATYVVSNADALQTFLELVGEDELPAPFVRRITRMTPSHSAYVAFVGTDLDLHELDLAHETFIPTSWDHEEEAEEIAAGRPAGTWIGAASLVDDSLAPPGEHAIAISAIAAWDIGRPWREHRETYCDLILERAERLIPHLRDHVTFLETATPETLYRFTSNNKGAIYGWDQIPMQSATRRLPHVTPIQGLLLSGHWTVPGSGSIRSFASGVHTAGIVLQELGAGPPIPPETAAAVNLPEFD